MNSRGFQLFSRLFICFSVAVMVLGQSVSLYDSVESDEIVQQEQTSTDESGEEENGIAGDLYVKAATDAVIPPLKASVEPILVLVVVLTFFVRKVVYSRVALPYHSQTSFQKLFRTSIFPKAP